MNWLLKNFLRGLVIVVPIALTIYVLYRAFVSLDHLLNLATPGLGLLIIVGATILIGALASNFVMSRLLRLTEVVFTRAPLVRLIYSAIKDLLEAFVGDKRRFDRPVSVAIGDVSGTRVLAFMTRDDLSPLQLADHVAVYVPYAYSLTGCLLLVPRSHVQPLAIDSATVMTMAVSGGVTRV